MQNAVCRISRTLTAFAGSVRVTSATALLLVPYEVDNQLHVQRIVDICCPIEIHLRREYTEQTGQNPSDHRPEDQQKKGDAHASQHDHNEQRAHELLDGIRHVDCRRAGGLAVDLVKSLGDDGRRDGRGRCSVTRQQQRSGHKNDLPGCHTEESWGLVAIFRGETILGDRLC